MSHYECKECHERYDDCRCDGSRAIFKVLPVADCPCDGSSATFKVLPVDDTVRNPSRYMLFPDVESIQIIARSFTVEEFRGFCLGNVLKYRLRAGKKDKVEQELAKADFYKELFERHKGECRAG